MIHRQTLLVLAVAATRIGGGQIDGVASWMLDRPLIGALVEFGLLGATAGVIAAAAGTAAAWGVVRFVMRADWVFLPGTLAVVVLACTALTLAFGYVGTALALRVPPAPLLRNE